MQTLGVVSSDEVEQQMVRIWQRVLGLDAIGVQNNFFELGGDSVMIIQIVRLIHETFQVSLPMHLMFEKTTIASLAEAVKQQQEISRHEQIADLIERVSQMSEEEALLLLEADLQ
jgi:acyl carrier protein